MDEQKLPPTPQETPPPTPVQSVSENAPIPTTQTQPDPTAAPSATPEIPPVSTQAPSNTLPPSEEEKKHMPIRTILLILLLAILAGVLLFVAINPIKKPPTAMHPVPTTKPSQAHTILSMIASQSATTASSPVSSQSVLVNIATSSNKVSGVQFEISYDPTVLSHVTIIPGTFFQNPLILLNLVDTKNGKINYAIGTQATANGISGADTVAIISYTLLPTATPAQTKLTFLPKTQAVQEGILGSVLEKAIDLTLPTATSIPATPSSSTSAK